MSSQCAKCFEIFDTWQAEEAHNERVARLGPCNFREIVAGLLKDWTEADAVECCSAIENALIEAGADIRDWYANA